MLSKKQASFFVGIDTDSLATFQSFLVMGHSEALRTAHQMKEHAAMTRSLRPGLLSVLVDWSISHV